MSDRKVLAVLVKAGDTTLDQPLGVGGLVYQSVALVVLDEEAELTNLTELEVLITPVPLGQDDEVERIRPAHVMTAKLDGTGETAAAIRLRHPSRYGQKCSIDPGSMVRELESERNVWRTGQKLGELGDRMTDAEVTAALEAARSAEEAYSARNLLQLGEVTAQEIGASCGVCRVC